jgi:hypothetical protein
MSHVQMLVIQAQTVPWKECTASFLDLPSETTYQSLGGLLLVSAASLQHDSFLFPASLQKYLPATSFAPNCDTTLYDCVFGWH